MAPTLASDETQMTLGQGLFYAWGTRSCAQPQEGSKMNETPGTQVIPWYPKEQQRSPETWAVWKITSRHNDEETLTVVEVPCLSLRGSHIVRIYEEGVPPMYTYFQEDDMLMCPHPGYMPEFLREAESWFYLEKVKDITDELANRIAKRLEDIIRGNARATRGPFPHSTPIKKERGGLRLQNVYDASIRFPPEYSPFEDDTWADWLYKSSGPALRMPPYMGMEFQLAMWPDEEIEEIGNGCRVKDWKLDTNEELLEDAKCWIAGRAYDGGLSAWDKPFGQLVPEDAPACRPSEVRKAFEEKGHKLQVVYTGGTGFWMAGVEDGATGKLRRKTVCHGKNLGSVMAQVLVEMQNY